MLSSIYPFFLFWVYKPLILLMISFQLYAQRPSPKNNFHHLQPGVPMRIHVLGLLPVYYIIYMPCICCLLPVHTVRERSPSMEKCILTERHKGYTQWTEWLCVKCCLCLWWYSLHTLDSIVGSEHTLALFTHTSNHKLNWFLNCVYTQALNVVTAHYTICNPLLIHVRMWILIPITD